MNLNIFLKYTWLVGLGGMLGAILRFWITEGIHHYIDRGFPVATLFINVTGSFFIGFLSIWLTTKIPYTKEYSSFLLIGVLGGYTTFSTFSLDTIRLLQNNHFGLAFSNIILSVFLSLLATAIGLGLAARIATIS